MRTIALGLLLLLPSVALCNTTTHEVDVSNRRQSEDYRKLGVLHLNDEDYIIPWWAEFELDGVAVSGGREFFKQVKRITGITIGDERGKIVTHISGSVKDE